MPQIREFQEYWDALLEGNLATRRHARFVPGEIAKNYIATKEPGLKDDYDEWLTRIVCYAFSVANQWAIKQMNRATAGTAQEQAEEEGLEPLKKWVKGTIDRLLAQVWGYPDLELAWTEEQAQDPLVQAQIADIHLKNGTLCLNDVRADLGREPVAGGDVHRIYTATGAIPLDQVDNPPTPAPGAIGHNGGPPLDDTGTGGEGDPAATAEGLAKGVPSIDRDRPAIQKLQARLEAAWRTYLADQGAQLARMLAPKFGLVMKAAGDEPEQPSHAPAEEVATAEGSAEVAAAGADTKTELAAIEAAVDAALASSPSSTILAATTEILQDAAIDGVGEGLAVIGNVAGVADMAHLTNPRAVTWAAEHAAQLVTGIDATTRTALVAAIVKAEDTGATVAQLTKEIEALGAFDPKRAALIARHELATADIQGNLTGWMTSNRELGLNIQKRAILGLNEEHCVACLANAHDGAIPLEEPFSSGAQASPFHPRCGCDLVPVIEGAEKMAQPGRLAGWKL